MRICGNMLYLIDSYAWIEYFLGSKKAEAFKKLLSNQENQFLTVECCLGEINGWSLRNKYNFEDFFKVIRADSQIVPLSQYDWILGAEERHEQRKTQKDFGLIDAILLVKQRQYQSKIISGDKHFKNLKNVVFLQ